MRYESTYFAALPGDGNSLQHFGIKGMKWGVRRFQNEDGSLTNAGKKRYENETPESDTWKKRDAKFLSDDELRRRNNRLNMEQQYRNLTTKDFEREKEQLKKDTIKKLIGAALTVPLIAIAGKYGKTYVPKAASFIGTHAKRALARIRTSGLLKKSNVIGKAAEQAGQRNWGGMMYQNANANIFRRANAGKALRNYNYYPRARGGVPRNWAWPKL